MTEKEKKVHLLDRNIWDCADADGSGIHVDTPSKTT